MGKKLYKYMGPDILSVSFERKGLVGFKCSYPKDYNDPYELFLNIDRNLPTELLAFYRESVGEIPQLPTSCFSKSPTVVPMWAHYAHTARGFVVEVDEDKLNEKTEELYISDIVYSDTPNDDIARNLGRAAMTLKPRHTYFFHNCLMQSAYFYKQSCWNYEQERRLVVNDSDLIESVRGNMILFVPEDCVTSIISGENTKNSHDSVAKAICEKLNISFYKSYIGKSFSSKYMLDLDNRAHVYCEGGIVLSPQVCDECGEPVSYENDEEDVSESSDVKCCWCSITEDHLVEAAMNNPYRLLDRMGLLDEHLRGMSEISRRR